MRYLKLAVGLLLAIAGLAFTVSVVGGMAWYLLSCPGPRGEILQHLCSMALRDFLFQLPIAVVFDFVAIWLIKTRARHEDAVSAASS